jgi:molecular chaperone GrpE
VSDRPTTDEVLDLLRQERADFRNYRRRVTDEREADLERLRGGLLEALLPVIEDLDRAFDTVPDQLGTEPWVQGVLLSRSRLGDLESELGLERVGATGERFNPMLHEALIYEPDPDATAPEAVVDQVIRPGFLANGQLLRPAQVVVRGPVLDTVREPDTIRPEATPPDEAAGG